ncbi:phosphatase homologous to the C-terminal domain of histone macroH2A1 [Candidatus Scalindua japonica]|uniref:Phosphatase homologous to the C-terminal domain of histone macroH2A1 n=1 Tax=Candidatus Scalindua japonica TaxID=1284222 RepID=A0A286TYT4_9BACT|nr:O-acetyl-ADP-ribose deacetylase [Candidatus Scalindua japonica]GAX61069.1 phosphatase homologous to the C-terminal domain of histone macroH2A1 [Candidatus Scalindua japonica]
MEKVIGKTKLSFIQGDITLQETEAIVNAANTSLLGGGGVDGAIHRAGGPKILEECKEIRAKQGGCPTGEAVITTGGNMAAEYVIHTVGPVWSGGSHKSRNESQLLRNAYYNSLNLAKKNGIKSISFPSISTGVYRFPIEKAARIALTTVKEFIEEYHFVEVRFVLFSEKDLRVYEEALREVT